MGTPSPHYDVFISYAREQLDWVEPHLYRRLLHCRTKLGTMPRIFFDKSRRDGVQPGMDFLETLGTALKMCRRIVPVYSWLYFQKGYCRWELCFAANRMIQDGDSRVINPVKIDEFGELPAPVFQIQYVTLDDSDWFERLCEGLELTPVDDRCQLEFLETPRDVPVNRTLPPVRVRIRDSQGRTFTLGQEELTVASECGELHGTTKVITDAGIATFADLSVSSPADSTRLVVTGEGLEPVHTEPFSVVSVSPPPPRHKPPEIGVSGEVTFFADGTALAVRRNGEVSVFAIDGPALLPPPGVAIPGQLRFQRAAGRLQVFADWSGNVCLLAADGRYHSFPFSVPSRPVTVPGDVAFEGEAVYLGMWSGDVFRLTLDGVVEHLFRHSAGVQAMAAANERIYIADFASRLCVYEHGKLSGSQQLEPRVLLIKAYQETLIAIGAEDLYQVFPDRDEVFHDKAPVAGVAAVWGDTRRPVIIDAHGKGWWLDSGGKTHASFHTAADAVPTSADDFGGYCVFRYPGGSHCLMARNKIVYSHTIGTLAVSRDGARLAVGEQGGVRLTSPTALGSSVQPSI